MENAQVKHLLRLREKAKYRRQCSLFMAEGPRMAREIPAQALDAVYVSQTYAAGHPQEAAEFEARAAAAGAGFEMLSDSVFAKVSGTVAPQGILCVVRQRTDTLEDLLHAQRPLCLLVLEGIQDPGNLGTMLRTGEAAGISGILADRQTADRYNPKVVRGTMGALLRVPYVVSEDLPEDIRALRALGVQTAATLPDARMTYTQADYAVDTAFLIGNEGNGLSETLEGLADIRIRIPMEGQVQSLNAAVAAALCMYEAKRWRDTADEQIRFF